MLEESAVRHDATRDEHRIDRAGYDVEGHREVEHDHRRHQLFFELVVHRAVVERFTCCSMSLRLSLPADRAFLPTTGSEAKRPRRRRRRAIWQASDRTP